MVSATCQNCSSTSIKSRTNYPYGRKSKSSRTSFMCRKCGSVKVSITAPNKFNRRKK